MDTWPSGMPWQELSGARFLAECHARNHKSPVPLTDILSESAIAADASDMLEHALRIAFEASAAVDAVVAKSTAQSQALWSLRENISEAQRFEGANIKHDILVLISAAPECVTRASAALEAALPGKRIVAFGHAASVPSMA